jgi:hypothetical protein
MVPGAQAVQEDWPDDATLPAAHGVGLTDGFAHLNPAGHTLQTRLVGAEYDPGPHAVHDVDPAAAYVPALQGTGNSEAFAHAYPKGHCVHDALPLETVYQPEGQG